MEEKRQPWWKVPEYHRTDINQCDLLQKIWSVRGKAHYEKGGNFLILDKKMNLVMHVYGHIYISRPECYGAGICVYVYDGDKKTAIFKVGNECVGSEKDVEDFVKELRGKGKLYIMLPIEYEKYINSTGRHYWTYGNMPLLSGSKVVIDQLVVNHVNRDDFTDETGTILYRFETDNPVIKLDKPVESQEVRKEPTAKTGPDGLVREIAPEKESIIRPFGIVS